MDAGTTGYCAYEQETQRGYSQRSHLRWRKWGEALWLLHFFCSPLHPCPVSHWLSWTPADIGGCETACRPWPSPRQKAEQKRERMTLRKTGQDRHNHFLILFYFIFSIIFTAWKILVNHFHQPHQKFFLAL